MAVDQLLHEMSPEPQPTPQAGKEREVITCAMERFLRGEIAGFYVGRSRRRTFLVTAPVLHQTTLK